MNNNDLFPPIKETHQEQKTFNRKIRKLRELITPDIRISLYQTCMNNTGRNFEGKKVTVNQMAKFSTELYKLAIKEIENIGELNIKQIESTFKKAPIKKVIKKRGFKKLLKKAQKNKKKRGKR